MLVVDDQFRNVALKTNGGTCQVSSFYDAGYKCTGALDGISRIGRPYEWASRETGPGAWFQAIFNDNYRIVRFQLTNRYGHRDEIKIVDVSLENIRQIAVIMFYIYFCYTSTVIV